MQKLKQLFTRWGSRHQRELQKALVYHSGRTTQELLAEYFELEEKLDRSSRSWELLLGLIATLLFSDELKTILAFLYSCILSVSVGDLSGSLLITVNVLLIIGMLLFLIALSHWNHSKLMKRYLILKYYLSEKEIIND